MNNKQSELIKYRDLVLATIDYQLNLYKSIETKDYNFSSYWEDLKPQTISHFNHGRLSILKRWFKDLSEPMRELRDFKFNEYLLERTGHKTDLFKKHPERIEKIIQKGKITSDNQFRDISAEVDNLLQTEPSNTLRIELLNNLLLNYEQQKIKKS